jgi:2-polyprenyl-6-hydroxyphenyl methylase/3-demethylubiquinone-9 3-methyltransferase
MPDRPAGCERRAAEYPGQFFADPSLLVPQLVAAIALALGMIHYFQGDARSVPLFVAILFGLLGPDSRRYLALTIAAEARIGECRFMIRRAGEPLGQAEDGGRRLSSFRPDVRRGRMGRTPPARSDPQRRQQMIPKNTICLWYDHDALEAATFYASIFPDTTVGAVHRAPGDFPGGKQGDVLTVEFTVMGIPCIGLNGGPVFKQDEAFSFQVATDDQSETDRYWNAIIGNGGQESDCGWCKDKWGVSWQITPRALTEAFTGNDRAAARRAFEAMLTMRKIDVGAIEAAVRG